ncbi:MAG: DMSO reductase [Gammaproteobacteria bacterium SG8_47]|nr:MAG: DMSO reductase [Gammaproteobacteria bacterium SG8_47]
MHPAFSVIFLTTLIGVGQGLFLALVTGQSYAAVQILPMQDSVTFFAWGSLIALIFLGLGLFASFFHLGHPERAWRAASQWRTSWLSREVIVLPALMGIIFFYGLMHYFGADPVLFVSPKGTSISLTLVIGLIGTLAAFALFVATGMIYACIKFLQEWATPLTVINFILLGGASGFVLATAFANYTAPELVPFFGGWAIIITLTGLVFRAASLIRNARIKHRSSLQTAIGVRHNQIVQKAQGQMGGSFNTREFFHGAAPALFNAAKWTFLVLVFPVPLVLLWGGLAGSDSAILLAAFGTQYVGLIAERWFFFAQSNHPQNLYYQTIG